MFLLLDAITVLCSTLKVVVVLCAVSMMFPTQSYIALCMMLLLHFVTSSSKMWTMMQAFYVTICFLLKCIIQSYVKLILTINLTHWTWHMRYLILRLVTTFADNDYPASICTLMPRPSSVYRCCPLPHLCNSNKLHSVQRVEVNLMDFTVSGHTAKYCRICYTLMWS